MRRFIGTIIALLAVMVTAACSSSGDSAESRLVRITYGQPSDLSELTSQQRNLSITLTKLVEGAESDDTVTSLLSFDEQNQYFSATLAEFPPGRYSTKITIYYVDENYPQSLSADSQTKVAETGGVPVAVYKLAINVVVGQPEIIIDAAPTDFALDIDSDSDGLPNLDEIKAGTDPYVADTDGDGVIDGNDLFPNVAAEQGDDDGDGVGNTVDNCRAVSNADQADFDTDGMGDACDLDADGDGVANNKDNCPTIQNSDQLDTDGDGLGNVCDPDIDADGIANAKDNCPLVANTDQVDNDYDGQGDVCDGDKDGDGVADAKDNCPLVANLDQKDIDGDKLGDLCDPDADGDGLTNIEETTAGADNLLTEAGSEDTDGDGVPDNVDNCPITTNLPPQVDTDGDGEGDACDCDSFSPSIKSAGAIFVAAGFGNDDNSGARNQPVKTITHGIELAVERGLTQVYVASGTYYETVTMTSGISVFGGFDLSNNGSQCGHELSSGTADANETVIINHTSPVVVFDQITAKTTLHGVIVMSDATTGAVTLLDITDSATTSETLVHVEDSYIIGPSIAGGTTVAVNVENANASFVNDVIFGGKAQTSVGINLLDSPATKILHNTIDGGLSTTLATALRSLRSVPLIANNILYTEGGSTQIELLFLDQAPSADISIRNNMLFGVKGANVDTPKLYMDYHPSFTHVYETVAGLNSLSVNFGGNIGYLGTLGNLFLNVTYPNNNWRLKAGTSAETAGINTGNTYGIVVAKDHDFGDRDEDAPDLGAFER